MPCSGCSDLHRVNSNLFFLKKKICFIFTLFLICLLLMYFICFLETFNYICQSNVTLCFFWRNFACCCSFLLTFLKIVNKQLIPVSFRSMSNFKVKVQFTDTIQTIQRFCNFFSIPFLVLVIHIYISKVYEPNPLRNITSCSLVHLIC